MTKTQKTEKPNTPADDTTKELIEGQGDSGATPPPAEPLAPGEGTPEQLARFQAFATPPEQRTPEQQALLNEIEQVITVPVTDKQVTAIAAAAAHLIAPNESAQAAMTHLGMTAPFTVIACESFGDNRTNRSYKPGDEVIGWSLARAKHYRKQGLVRIEEAGDGLPE